VRVGIYSWDHCDSRRHGRVFILVRFSSCMACAMRSGFSFGVTDCCMSIRPWHRHDKRSDASPLQDKDLAAPVIGSKDDGGV